GGGGRCGGPRRPPQPAAHQRCHDHRDGLGRHPVVPVAAGWWHGGGVRAVRRRSALVRGAGPDAAGGERHRCAAHPAQGAGGRPAPRRPALPRHPRRPLRGAPHVSPFQLTRTLPEDATDAALRADVRSGLTASPRTLPPKWFYDAHGSELFERITELPEYYPTRAEREILLARSGETAAASGARTLVELGSGSSEKTRHLLDALTGLHTYVPVDVSESALTRPGLRVHALIADFTTSLTLPDERAAFLSSVRALLAPGDALLLGTDLVKDEEVLVRAYDDAAGVTAAFNKNVLTVINRELGADF